MTRALRLLAILSLLPFAAACGILGDDIDEEPEAPVVDAGPMVRSVDDVRSIEIGRTRDGVVVTAYGIAPGIGYALPRLEPRRNGRLGTDGFLDFDFVANAPDPGFQMPQGQVQARVLRADRLIGVNTLSSAAGIRVHGRSGGKQFEF